MTYWPSLDALPSPLQRGTARPLRPAEDRASWIVDEVPGDAVIERTVELFSLRSHRWSGVSASAALPALEGPAFCRILAG